MEQIITRRIDETGFSHTIIYSDGRERGYGFIDEKYAPTLSKEEIVIIVGHQEQMKKNKLIPCLTSKI